MFQNILVPVDGSEHAKRAVQAAAELATKFESQLTLLHVMPRAGSHRIPAELQEFARAEHLTVNEAEILQNVATSIVERAKIQAQSEGVKNANTAVEIGDAASRIIEYSEKNAIDTIVMGRRGLSDLAGLFLGSVTHKVSQGTRLTCVTVGGD